MRHSTRLHVLPNGFRNAIPLAYPSRHFRTPKSADMNIIGHLNIIALQLAVQKRSAPPHTTMDLGLSTEFMVRIDNTISSDISRVYSTSYYVNFVCSISTQKILDKCTSFYCFSVYTYIS